MYDLQSSVPTPEKRKPAGNKRTTHSHPQESYSFQKFSSASRASYGLPEKVTEERHGVVQLHLFVVQSQCEEDRTGDVVVSCDCDNGPEREAQTGTVILKVSVINDY